VTMADAETLRSRLCRRPIDVAPSVYDALTGAKELPALGPRYDATVQPTDDRSSLPG
jgi:hypothetical protein